MSDKWQNESASCAISSNIAGYASQKVSKVIVSCHLKCRKLCTHLYEVVQLFKYPYRFTQSRIPRILSIE